MQVPKPQWILRESPEISPEFSLETQGLPPLVRTLLAQRQLIQPGKLREFLDPKLKDLSDPFALPGMHQAVPRLFQAIDQQEKVVIYGDYDVDGITSVVLMRQLLEAYGLAPSHFVPVRSAEGYGLSAAAIQRLLRENGKPNLLICVDCGTASITEIADLSAQGIEVVVLDHHEPKPEALPQCAAVVNPKIGSEFDYLCAAGVVFKLAHAMLKTRQLAHFDLRHYIDLVAIATIADIVPLIGENRLLVRHGLKQIQHSIHPGLRAIATCAGLNLNESLQSQDIGFRIGPRINAAGRMDQPSDAIDLLLTQDPDFAATLAAKLDDFNRQRQNLENTMRTEALSMLHAEHSPLNDPVIVLGSRHWHPGVVGIVASRLMRQYYKPCFIISIDEQGIGKASGRSVEGISLVEAIQHCRSSLIAGGGHAMAAGLTLEESKLDAFRQHFADFVLNATTAQARQARIFIDALVPFSELSLDLLDSYSQLQPFGNQNPQPLLMSHAVELYEEPRHLKNKHLKLTFIQDGCIQEAMFFGGGDTELPDGPMDIAFTLERNSFRGIVSLQLHIVAIRPSAPLS